MNHTISVAIPESTGWKSEARSTEPRKFPKIQPPILPAGMSPAQRHELKSLAERLGQNYGSFARTSKALDDLEAWVEAYKAGRA